MSTSAHAELSAIRPVMALAIRHLVPAASALLAMKTMGYAMDGMVALAVLVAMSIFLATSGGVDVVDVERHQHRYMYAAASSVMKALEMSIVVGVMIMIVDRRDSPFQSGLQFAMIHIPAMFLMSIGAIRLALLPGLRRPIRRVAIVGINATSLRFARKLASDPFLSVEFAGFFEDRHMDRLPPSAAGRIVAKIDGMQRFLARHPVDHVFISLPGAGECRMNQVLDQLLNASASVHYLHDYVNFKPIHESIAWVGGVPVHTVIGRPDVDLSGVLKRVFDLVVSAAALVLLSPLLLIVAVLVRLESPGPALFTQVRYGEDGKPFSIYKFRSMTTAACASTEVRQATQGDARVTRLGRFLRRSSIDELPQLLNILRGEMSVVGPRPHAVPHNEHYRTLIRGYMLRHKVKPGLTGWAQIHGLRGETETLEKMAHRVQFDLDYLRQWSLALDVYIVLCTFRQVFKGV